MKFLVIGLEGEDERFLVQAGNAGYDTIEQAIQQYTFLIDQAHTFAAKRFRQAQVDFERTSKALEKLTKLDGYRVVAGP